MKTTFTALAAVTLLGGGLLLPAQAAAPVAGGSTAPSGTPCIGSDGKTRGDKSAASGAPETHRINPPGSAEPACDETDSMPGHPSMKATPPTPESGNGTVPQPNTPLRDGSGPQPKPRSQP